jgi:alpha-beta hydrolase superfamily lysophospholipase
MIPLTRRQLALGLLGAALAAEETESRVLRLRVAGEWCFVKFPVGKGNGQAVLILHGAGEWVSETSSSWETQTGATRLIDALLDAGYVVAQSNSAARDGNGMWGNSDTQKTTAAFLNRLAHEHGFRRVHAIAVSAGNLILANLLLGGKAKFETAVMLAPCLSLVSEYKCPGGINRVKTIAEAYHFAPKSGCPGNPAADTAFVNATAQDDPLRRVERLNDKQIRATFGATRFLAIYETHDPRVPPAENLFPFAARLKHAGVPLQILAMEADTHGSQELFLRHITAILAFI